MRVLAIGAQKGGCGKSTSTLYFATRAAEMFGGTRDNPAVAIIDRDESKNLSVLLHEFPDLIRPGVERRSLAIASHWPFDQWGHFLPEQATAVALLDRLLHHATVVVTAGESYRMREARTRGGGATLVSA